MLLCLRVRNFAIIDALEVEFGQGFNVLTGETGAGKSILVDALQLVLGERGRAEVVRTGAEQAEVEALFDVTDDPDLAVRLETMGIEAADELVVRRVVQANGRTRAYINGRLASATQLGELAAGLANISSQHEHHSLIEPSGHLQLLDAYGNLATARAEVSLAYTTLLGASEALEAIHQQARDRGEREDLLRFQIAEIDEIEPQPGEIELLKEERGRQRHAERLATVTGGAEDALYASDDALCGALARIVSELEQAAELDGSLQAAVEQLRSAHAVLEEAARDVGHYARSIQMDPERLTEVETRLDRLERVMRKHGGSLEAVLERRDQAREELAGLEQSEERLEQLQTARAAAQRSAETAARELSQARKRAAKKLSTAVSKELASLGMGDARITVEVETAHGRGELSVDGARLSANGIDRVEFLIATNRGEEPQPLRKIASGGELSRAMLGIKRVLAGLGPAGLYVFDEVDAGVGGAVAEVIGRKVQEVAAHHQVICITHLPQIAAFADAHYRVRKAVSDGRTRSEITRLSAAEQREEIARMLGGITITKKTREAAAEMLKTARGALTAEA